MEGKPSVDTPIRCGKEMVINGAVRHVQEMEFQTNLSGGRNLHYTHTNTHTLYKRRPGGPPICFLVFRAKIGLHFCVVYIGETYSNVFRAVLFLSDCW
jgi:hypothetical protein